jgi:hypothetical protein
MEYLTGYTIKPYSTTPLGAVVFTDGTNTEIQANQQTCQAYGYTYDEASGTCMAFRLNTNLEKNINNENNRNNGAGNINQLGSNTIQVNGSNNTTKGFNNNCFINGNANEIANGVNNAIVLGSNGEARIDCEFVTSSSDGVGQYSIFFLSGRTTTDHFVSLNVNGEAGVTVIPKHNGAGVLYRYVIELTSYRTGGTSASGAAGDRGFFRIEGMVEDSGVNEVYTTVVSKGFIVGITFVTAYSGSDMSVKVGGILDQTLDWGATAKFYQMKLTL